MDESRLLNSLGIVARAQQAFDQSIHYLTECLHLTRELGYKRGIGLAHGNLGSTYLLQGDYSAARREYEACLQLGRATASPEMISDTLFNLALVATRLGDYPTAQRQLTETLALKQQLGHRLMEAKCWIALGYLAFCQEQFAQAQQQLEHGLALARELGSRAVEADALSNLARVYLALDQVTAAAEAVQQVRQIRQALGQSALQLAAEADWLEVLLAQRDWPALRTHFETTLTALTTQSLAGMYDPLRVYLVCYQVAVTLGDTRSDLILNQAQQRLHELASRISDETARFSFLHQVASHHQILQAADNSRASDAKT